MLLITFTHLLLVLLGVCVSTGAVKSVADPADSAAPGTLTKGDLVIIISTDSSRVPLAHASRPARRGIRTFIFVETPSEAKRLNDVFGGPRSEFNETYLSWPDATPNATAASSASGASGSSSRDAANPGQLHPLHKLGPRWAIAPILVHELLTKPSNPSGKKRTLASDSAAAGATTDEPPPPPPYRWMLVARDDTLWVPRHLVRLLTRLYGSVSPHAAAAAAAVSDHFIDFNGLTLLAPSPAAAVCLPCGANMTALVGRRHPPGYPQPGCPVCRPAAGCEFRFDLCRGLVGGPLCGSRRFLGSGDRCAHSWAAGGAGVALSYKLLAYLDKDEWVSCVDQQQPSTGERALGRCLWRSGYAFTHPASGLAAGRTKRVFSERHMLFGNPLVRQDIFGIDAETLFLAAYNAAVERVVAAQAADPAAAAAAAATTAGATMAQDAAMAQAATTAGGSDGDGAGGASSASSTATAAAALASTRLRLAGSDDCDAECTAWLASHVISVHLDVPYEGGVDITAAAGLMERAAGRVRSGKTTAGD